MDTCDRHFRMTLLSPNAHRATARAIRPAQTPQRVHSRAQNAHRATARAIRLTQCAQRVRFACSICAPRRSESNSTHPKSSLPVRKMRTAIDLTHPKCAEGSLRVRKMCATARAISLSQSDVFATKPTPRRTQNARRTTARVIRSPKERTRFASRSQNVHRATARAISLSK